MNIGTDFDEDYQYDDGVLYEDDEEDDEEFDDMNLEYRPLRPMLTVYLPGDGPT